MVEYACRRPGKPEAGGWFSIEWFDRGSFVRDLYIFLILLAGVPLHNDRWTGEEIYAFCLDFGVRGCSCECVIPRVTLFVPRHQLIVLVNENLSTISLVTLCRFSLASSFENIRFFYNAILKPRDSPIRRSELRFQVKFTRCLRFFYTLCV